MALAFDALEAGATPFSLSFAGTASAERPLPSWYNAQQVHDAGAVGVRVGEEALNTECPGVQGPGVSAAGCIVARAGCTANFIPPGDSGSPVLTAAGQAAGDFTHLIVDPGTYPAPRSPARASPRRCRSSASRS